MKLQNDQAGYGAVSQVLHWGTLVLVAALITMGKIGDIDPEHPRAALFIWHSSLGVLVLLLTAWRLAWRFISPPPPLPARTSRWGRRLAGLVHLALYLALFALPLSGWLAASTEGARVSFFGVIGFPVAPLSESAAEGMEEIHELLGDALLVLVGLHLLAALKHHWIDRDNVLERMLPWSRPASPQPLSSATVAGLPRRGL